MKTKSFTRWEKSRTKGKWNYIIKWGVLTWGISMALGATTSNLILLSDRLIIENILLNFIIYPIGGLVWGIFMWHFSEDAYLKHLKDKTITRMETK